MVLAVSRGSAILSVQTLITMRISIVFTAERDARIPLCQTRVVPKTSKANRINGTRK